MHGLYPSFAWLPDAKSLVVWAQGKIWRVDPFKKTAVEIPFHVKDQREVREAPRVARAMPLAVVAQDHHAGSRHHRPDGRDHRAQATAIEAVQAARAAVRVFHRAQ